MERVTMELSGGAARVRWICWPLPPVGVIKANFDAAIWDDGRATAGYILCNNTGDILVAGFVWERSIVDAAELRGTLEANTSYSRILP